MTTPLALITGATGGIGRAVCDRLWHEGYSIIALGHTTSKIAELNDWFLEHPGSEQYGIAILLDLDCPDDLWTMHALLQHAPGNTHELELLVVCHGHAPVVKDTLQLTRGDMRRVWNVDVLGTLIMCQLAGRYMLPKQQGSIVVVSSVHTKQTYPQRTLYGAAKSALSGLVRGLAVEWGPSGIRTNAVCPWQVIGKRSTHFIEAAAALGEDLLEQYKQRSPMRRLIQPEEVADAVLFLARNQACNGVELILDGGVSQSMWYKGFVEQEEKTDDA